MQLEQDPDSSWVARLADCSVALAARSIREAAEDQRLFRHLTDEHAREGRASYIEIDAPLELYALARILRPRHVVEVGVSSGVSSAYLLRALERNGSGTLHSVDLPKRPPRRGPPSRRSWSLPPGRESGWAVPFYLRKRWDLRLGDKRDVLPLLAEELDRIGLFVYDVPHEDRRSYREFLGLDARLPRGSVAIVDHGPGGELCEALARWARRRGASPIGRTGLGLFGFRCGRAVGQPRTVDGSTSRSGTCRA